MVMMLITQIRLKSNLSERILLNHKLTKSTRTAFTFHKSVKGMNLASVLKVQIPRLAV